MSTFDSALHLPSCPYRLPRFFLYFRDLDRRLRGGHGFVSKGAAHGMVRHLLECMPEHKLRWVSPTSLDTGCGILIEGQSLEDIMESDPVSLPYPYPSLAAGISGRDPALFMPEDYRAGDDTSSKSRRKRRDKPSEAAEPRAPSASGETTAADLGAELGMSPGAVRRVLREASIAKPYLWTDQAELDKVRALLKGAKR